MEHASEQYIARQLDAGERLLWSGRPGQGTRLRASDGLFIPFSLLWGGFAFFWEFMAFRMKAPFFFRLWGVPFVLVGIYMVAGRFFWDARRRARVVYTVTDKRIIVVDGGFYRSTRTLNLKTLNEITLFERRDGSGDVVLGAMPFGTTPARGNWPGAGAQVPTLEFLPRAREVYDIIRHAQARA